MNETINKEKLAGALGSIRKDIATLHKDLAGGVGGNQTFWLFIIMWLSVANLVKEFYDMTISLLIAAAIIVVFRLLDSIRLRWNINRDLRELADYDPEIDLS